MYEIFEHTADVGIRVRAASVDELFADAARGLFAVIVTNPGSIRVTEEIDFQFHGDKFEDLLHDWLSELLYTFHGRHLVLADFEVHIVNGEMSAVGRGEPFDPSRHEVDAEVKAITWHGLKVEQNAGSWMAEVIVDV